MQLVQQVNEKNWQQSLILVLVCLAFLFVVYFSSFSSMISIWARSDTFAHGFLIFPIVLWLVWRSRSQVLSINPCPNFWGLPILAVFGFVWLVAKYSGLLVIEQLAVVAMIPVLLFALLGWNVIKILAFPLFFLVFAVPMGEELVPALINFTADFTVGMVQFVGIPIYREGNFFQLPSGNWSVVSACSGVRYLIASLTLGCLYAYLNYQSVYKRTIFIAFSIVVPIIANGFRAFMIVMIGHYSDMQLATGVDHLLYGWLFFGIVIGIMFYLGSFWRDDEHLIVEKKNGDQPVTHGSEKKTYLIFVSILIITMVWPLKVYLEDNEAIPSTLAKLDRPFIPGWEYSTSELTQWRPDYQGIDVALSATYRKNSNEIMLFVGHYVKQRQDAELVNASNVLVSEKNKQWRILENGKLKVELQNQSLLIPTAIISSPGNFYKVAYFYDINKQFSVGKLNTKFIEAKARLLGESSAGSIIMAVIQLDDITDDRDKVLVEFLNSVTPFVRQEVNKLKVMP